MSIEYHKEDGRTPTIDLLLIDRLFEQVIILGVRGEKVGRVGDGGEDAVAIIRRFDGGSRSRGQIGHVENRGIRVLHFRHDYCGEGTMSTQGRGAKKRAEIDSYRTCTYRGILGFFLALSASLFLSTFFFS